MIFPVSQCSMPARILSSVDFPDPFGPIRPVRSVSSKPIEMSLNNVRTPNDLEMDSQWRSKVIGNGSKELPPRILVRLQHRSLEAIWMSPAG